LRRPIIILGTARSGTTLLARVVGASPEVFLVTEIAPRLKNRFCPEDRSGVCDSELWRRHFDFTAWQIDRSRPVCERPIFDPAKIESMRRRYIEMAGGKRLVIKNPLCVARVDILKAMFPDALFVFSLRAAWQTIQAATIKGNSAYILPTEFVNSWPADLILRAAASWAESIDVLVRERNPDWLVIKYEELIANPESVIRGLYRDAGLERLPEQVVHLPENRKRDYSFIKYRLMCHPYRNEIISLIKERALFLGYDARLSSLPGSGLRYGAEMWLNENWPRRKRRKVRSKQPAYAVA
jgi:hypothetical protein